MATALYFPARDGLKNWTGELIRSGTLSIVDNQVLKLRRANDGTDNDRFAGYIPFDSIDGELYAVFNTLPLTGTDGLMGIFAMRWKEPSVRAGEPSGYTLSIIPDRSATSGYSLWLENGIRKLASYPLPYYKHTNDYCARFSVTGSIVKAKVWPSADSEPGWQIVLSDSSVQGGQDRKRNGVFTHNGGSVDYRFISFGFGGSSAPSINDLTPESTASKQLDNTGFIAGPLGGFPVGGAYVPVDNKPKVYALTGGRATERLTISRPTLTAIGPTYNLRGTRGWVHLVFKKPPPKLTYIPPKPGELRPVQTTERLTIRPPTLSHIGPIYALRPSRLTERIDISSPTLTAFTAALMSPQSINLRVGISSPNVIFIPKPEVLELKPSPILARLTITRTDNLLDPSVYNIEYKQYKSDYVGIKAYEGETLDIDRYRPDTIETGKIDSIKLNTNRYKQIVIK